MFDKLEKETQAIAIKKQQQPKKKPVSKKAAVSPTKKLVKSEETVTEDES